MCKCCVPHSITCSCFVFLTVSHVHALCSSQHHTCTYRVPTVSQVHVLCSSQYHMCTCCIPHSITCARVVFLTVSQVHVLFFSQYHMCTFRVPTVSHVHVSCLNTSFYKLKQPNSIFPLTSNYCNGQYEECKKDNTYSCSY